MKTLLRILLVLSLSLTPLLASFENTQRSLLPANTNSRAPRQGLVFDGTADATFSNITLGSGDFTVAVWARVPTTSAANRQLLGSSGGDTALFLDTTGLAKIYISGQTTHTASSVVPDQKSVLIVYTRSGMSGTFYQNAVSNGTVTDSNNYSTAWSYFGARSGGGYTTGTLIPLIYNRALSASEVLALYESGAPAGADYNSASNTSVYSTDFSTSTGWTAETGWSITGGVAVVSGTNAAALYRSAVSSLKQGSRYRITFTVSSYVSGGVRPWIQIGSSRVLGTARTANGTYTEEIIAPSATGLSYVGIEVSTSAACSLNVDDYSYFNSGLLLAPDAAQAGGGYVWNDTSGNAANISWTSGVSWNVPSSRVLGGAWTVQGNLSVNANQVLQTATSDTIYAYNQIRTSLSTGGGLFGVEGNAAGSLISGTNAYATVVSSTSSGTDLQFGTSGVVRATIGKTTGNLLIGTTTDVGAKVYSKVADGVLSFGAAGTTKGIRFAHASTYSTIDGVDSSLSGSYQPLQINGSTVQIATNGGTVAASFDTSQNATFANGLVAGKTLSVNSITGGDAGAGTSIISFKDGLGATKVNITGDGKVVLSNTAASTSTTTGALTVSGGVGIAGALNAGGNVTASDAILGTSGPSVKSTLSARAPRQGLVFDNTLKASITNGAILGTSDFTVAAWINRPASDLSVPLWGPSNSIGFAIRATQITVEKIGATLEAAWDYTVASSKFVSVIVKRSGTTYTCFVDGISIGDKTVGSVTNFSAAYSDVGFTNYTNGTIVGPYAYNRALSASEVVALYEAGAPAGADYNSASNTSLAVTSFSNDATDPYDSFSGASATGFSAVSNGSGTKRARSGSFSAVSGKKYRISFTATLNSGSLPGGCYLAQGASGNTSAQTGGVITVTAGSNSQEITASYTGTVNFEFFHASSAGNYTISNFVAAPIGLLLAPDAAQAGGGLVWYDTSGNAANITLPASGVSWNVPTSGNLAGNLQVNGTGNNVFRGPIRWGNTAYPGYNGYITETNTSSQLIPAITRNLIGTTGNTQYTIANAELGAYAAFELGTDIRWFAGSGTFTTGQTITPTELMRLTQVNGNLIIGSPSTDVGDKLQVNGSISASPSGAGYLVFTRHGSQNTGLYYNGAQGLVLYTNTTTALTLDSSQNATFAGQVNILNANSYLTSDASNLVYETYAGKGHQFKTGGTTALTLDSSQNAAFAGTSVTVDGASTGSTLTLKRASNANGAIISYKTTTTSKWYHGLRGLVDDNWYLQNDVAGNTALFFDASTSNATFGGATVNVSKAGNNPAFKATDGSIITKLQSLTAGDTAGWVGTESNHTFRIVTNNTTAASFDTSQNATFAGTVTAPQFKSATGSVSATNGNATTLFSLSGVSNQLLMVHVYINVGDAANYAAYATIAMDGSAARIVSNNASLMTITLSGANVQATQNSGITQSILWKYTSL